MALSPASLKLVGFFIVQKGCMRRSSVQNTENYTDLLNSDVGAQVGRVLILDVNLSAKTQAMRK